MSQGDRKVRVGRTQGVRGTPGVWRIAIAVLALVVVIGGVLGIDALRRRTGAIQEGAEVIVLPGAVPIYVEGRLAAGFGPDDLEQLEQVSFVDVEEGKSQEGWLLSDVLLLYLPEDTLTGAEVEVSSSSRDKAVRMTWDEVRDRENMIMFDLSGRGTLKLVSLLERLDVRDEWIQDVDRIEVLKP